MTLTLLFSVAGRSWGNTETRFGSLGIFLTLFSIGGALIDTAVVNAVSYFSFEFIACFLLGLFMVVVSFLSFYGFVLPAWRDKSYTLKNELKDLVTEDQSGKQDSDATERLITGFRNSLRDFFDTPGLPENSLLQNTATQLYWHILYLQKRRMDQMGITLDFDAVRKSYGGVSVIKHKHFDGKYMITDAKERIEATREYKKDHKVIHKKKDSELAHYSMLNAKRASKENRVICPNCGNPTTRENLLDGCDYCGTKFTVEDLGNRVSSFGLRQDYQVAYDKYTDAREHYGTRAFLLGAVPIFIICMIYGLFIMEELDSGLFMHFAATFFSSAVCAALMGYVVKYGFWVTLFPVLQLKQSITYRTRKKLKELKQRESKNDSIEKEIRGFDERFSLEHFFSNIQNKLAAIHYAANNSQARAFAAIELSPYLEYYNDVADMDVTEMELLDFHHDESSQYIHMKAIANLTRFKGNRCRETSETLELKLTKSAACKTQAVCGPSVLKCKNCGASISLLNGGRCEYCDSELNLWEHDWVIAEYSITAS